MPKKSVPPAHRSPDSPPEGQPADLPGKQDLYPNLNRGGNTPDNQYGSGAPRSDVRPLDRSLQSLTYGKPPRSVLRDAFVQRLAPVLELADQLIEQARDGQLRTTEVIKLVDVIAKYAVGPVQTTELQGEDGQPVKIQFSFGQQRPEAHMYLAEVRERVRLQSQTAVGGQTQVQSLPPSSEPPTAVEPRSGSDNDRYDVPISNLDSGQTQSSR